MREKHQLNNNNNKINLISCLGERRNNTTSNI